MLPRALPFGPLSTTRYSVNGVVFDMARVPPGRFVDGEGWSKRALLVSRPFEIGATLVTQALWRAVTGMSPSRYRGDDLPVEQVSWDDAQAFLGQLEALGFLGFRLPTEAEWAWAARCGVPTRWAGVDRVKSVAVVDRAESAPVGGLFPSAVGAFDFSGNLWELQRDGWSDTFAAGVDAWRPPSRLFCVRHGGSWFSDPLSARVATRSHIASDDRRSALGVRLARSTS